MKYTPEETAKAVQDLAACGDAQEWARFTKLVVQCHLTNQQRLTKLVYQLIKALAAYPYEDLRNQQAKKFVRLVLEAVGEDFPFPLI